MSDAPREIWVGKPYNADYIRKDIAQAELDAAVRAERDRWRGLLGRYACHVAEYEGTYYLDREPPVDADEATLRKSLGGGWLPYEDHADVQAAIDDAIRGSG